MGTVSTTLPSDGQTIDASDVNTPINAILSEFNGNIDDDNIKSAANINGSKLLDASITGAKQDATLASGWLSLSGTHSVTSGYNSGNRSFEIATSTDHSSALSEGMRYRVTRNTTPPTQCADLEASSSHYASKASPTGITFTTTYTCEAWIKLESYPSSGFIIGRRNGSTEGFSLLIDSAGAVNLWSGRIASNNKQITSYQSIPLNKWVHVAATMDMTAGDTSAQVIWIDGVEVPRSYTLTGTATALVQGTTALTLGARSTPDLYFDGKMADVRVWSDQRSTTEIQDNMYAYPSDTTGLVAHFKLNGDFTDASSNGNDLTAQNSAVATNADNPWNATEYGIITAVSASTIQVFCPEGYGIPNETLTAPYYSTQSAPYGFPRGKDKWSLEAWFLADSDNVTTASSWQDTSFNAPTLPIGPWDIAYRLRTRISTTSGDVYTAVTLSSDTSTETYPDLTNFFTIDGTNGTFSGFIPLDLAGTVINVTSQTTLNILIYHGTANVTIHRIDGSDTLAQCWVKAYCAYL